MGLYHRWIFPLLCDRTLRGREFAEQRRVLLSKARGDVLEIGIGTGLNLPHYPNDVTRIVGVEPNPGMRRRLEQRIGETSIPVEVLPGDASAGLSLPDQSFDTVVSTWTLCSVPDVPAALREIHRLLRPGGVFLFVEHGLSPEPSVARWQRWLTPIQKRLGDGCHLDRDVRRFIDGSPLKLHSCETFALRSMPKIGAYTYRGSAGRA